MSAERSFRILGTWLIDYAVPHDGPLGGREVVNPVTFKPGGILVAALKFGLMLKITQNWL